MTREEYARCLIKSAGYSVKSFAKLVDLPYTTLLGMLKSGLGGAAVDNVVKLCKGLGVTVEDIVRVEDARGMVEPFYVNERERLVITRYRELSKMRPAIDTLLGIVKAPDPASDPP